MQYHVCLFRAFLITSFIATEAGMLRNAQAAEPKIELSKQEFVSALRARALKFADKLVSKDSGVTELADEVHLYRALADEGTSPETMAADVVRFLRKTYAETLGPPGEQLMVTRSRTSAGDLPLILFVLKGRTDGLFEYTRLTRSTPATLPDLWKEQGQAWNNEELLSYMIFSVLQYDQLAREQFYSGKGSLIYTDLTPELVALRERFPGNRRVSDFLTTYPFESQSFIYLNQKVPAVAALQDGASLLCTYFLKVLNENESRQVFAERILTTYGRKGFGNFVMKLSESSADDLDGPTVSKIAELAIESENLQAALRMQTKWPEIDIGRMVAKKLEAMQASQQAYQEAAIRLNTGSTTQQTGRGKQESERQPESVGLPKENSAGDQERSAGHPAAIKSAVRASDAIKFSATPIDVVIVPDRKDYVVKILFSVVGQKQVTITDVKGSCSCMGFDLGKRTYSPGESGEVTLRMKPSSTRTLPSTETVSFEIDEDGPRRASAYIRLVADKATPVN